MTSACFSFILPCQVHIITNRKEIKHRNALRAKHDIVITNKKKIETESFCTLI